MLAKRGKELRIIDNFNALETIPNSVFLLVQDSQTGELYLEDSDDFTLPDKIYGDYQGISERYLNTYKEKSGNLGILLTGLKGTGKSLLAKYVCIQSKMPVILIMAPFNGNPLKQFLNSIKQECIIFIDEFEKVYSKIAEDQEPLLSILDGVFSTKKLFIFTANQTHNLTQLLFNRPGRIHYLKEYEGLDDKVMDLVIDDNLINKKEKDALKQKLFLIGDINMDLLLTIIREMNQYNESAASSLAYLNVRPEDVTYKVNGEVICSLQDQESGQKISGINKDGTHIPYTRELGSSIKFPIEFYAYENPLDTGNYNSFEFSGQEISFENRVRARYYIEWDKAEVETTITRKSIKILNKLSGEFLVFTKKPIAKINYLTM